MCLSVIMWHNKMWQLYVDGFAISLHNKTTWTPAVICYTMLRMMSSSQLCYDVTIAPAVPRDTDISQCALTCHLDVSFDYWSFSPPFLFIRVSMRPPSPIQLLLLTVIMSSACRVTARQQNGFGIMFLRWYELSVCILSVTWPAMINAVFSIATCQFWYPVDGNVSSTIISQRNTKTGRESTQGFDGLMARVTVSFASLLVQFSTMSVIAGWWTPWRLSFTDQWRESHRR